MFAEHIRLLPQIRMQVAILCASIFANLLCAPMQSWPTFTIALAMLPKPTSAGVADPSAWRLIGLVPIVLKLLIYVNLQYLRPQFALAYPAFVMELADRPGAADMMLGVVHALRQRADYRRGLAILRYDLYKAFAHVERRHLADASAWAGANPHNVRFMLLTMARVEYDIRCPLPGDTKPWAPTRGVCQGRPDSTEAFVLVACWALREAWQHCQDHALGMKCNDLYLPWLLYIDDLVIFAHNAAMLETIATLVWKAFHSVGLVLAWTKVKWVASKYLVRREISIVGRNLAAQPLGTSVKVLGLQVTAEGHLPNMEQAKRSRLNWHLQSVLRPVRGLLPVDALARRIDLRLSGVLAWALHLLHLLLLLPDG